MEAYAVDFLLSPVATISVSFNGSNDIWRVTAREKSTPGHSSCALAWIATM